MWSIGDGLTKGSCWIPNQRFTEEAEQTNMGRMKKTLSVVGLVLASLILMFWVSVFLVYKGAIPIAPVPEWLTQRIRGENYRFYAYGWEDETILLRFEANEAAIARIVREFDLHEAATVKHDDRRLCGFLDEPPVWWTTGRGSDIRILKSEGPNRTYFSIQLVYNPRNGRALFIYSTY
jgi:hypothetical protein